MRKVAVIIPAHNEETYIENTLLSLKNQTVKPIAIVVVNDGSTDRTADIVNEFRHECNECIVYLINLTRSAGYGKGIVRNLNLGKKWLDEHSIQYDYLMVLDADQRLSRNYIELCLNAFDSSTAIVSGSTHGIKFNPIQPRGAHRIYAKWFIEKHPFPSVKGYDSQIFHQALQNNYKVKKIRAAIAYETRAPRVCYIDHFDRGVYSYKLGYSLPFLFGRTLKNVIVLHRLKAILMIYGFIFSVLIKKKRYSVFKNISLHQKQRIKRMILRILP